jgi:hypothetical protein
LTKTIIATVTKAAIAYGLNEGTKKDETLDFLTRTAGTVYQAGMNRADLRTWQTLPKQFQIARFTTPSNRLITVKLPNGTMLPPVKLKEGTVRPTMKQHSSNPKVFVG